MELTPAEAASLSALIDQCLKILKESNERSEQISSSAKISWY
jgi:hypothetical protein